MKVICINNKKPLQLERLLPMHWIYEGERYTVTEEFLYPGIFYLLAERDLGSDRALHNSYRIISMSKIDETQMARLAEEKSLKMKFNISNYSKLVLVNS